LIDRLIGGLAQFICAYGRWINSSQSRCIRPHLATRIGKSRQSPAFFIVSIQAVSLLLDGD